LLSILLEVRVGSGMVANSSRTQLLSVVEAVLLEGGGRRFVLVRLNFILDRILIMDLLHVQGLPVAAQQVLFPGPVLLRRVFRVVQIFVAVLDVGISGFLLHMMGTHPIYVSKVALLLPGAN
jgi:hypothetical protein